jgi:hypothetical protein
MSDEWESLERTLRDKEWQRRVLDTQREHSM